MTQYESIGHVKFYIFTDVPHTHLQRLNFVLALNTMFKTNSFQKQEREKEERGSVWKSQLLRGSSSPAR